MVVLIILIDNLLAGGHSNWGTLSPTATVLQIIWKTDCKLGDQIPTKELDPKTLYSFNNLYIFIK